MRTPLDETTAANMRAWADRERAATPALAEVLDDIAANGLPDEDEGTPWEEIRDAHYRELGIDPSRWHVA